MELFEIKDLESLVKIAADKELTPEEEAALEAKWIEDFDKNFEEGYVDPNKTEYVNIPGYKGVNPKYTDDMSEGEHPEISSIEQAKRELRKLEPPKSPSEGLENFDESKSISSEDRPQNDDQVFVEILEGTITGITKYGVTKRYQPSIGNCVQPEVIDNFFVQEKELEFGADKCLFDTKSTSLSDNGCTFTFLKPQVSTDGEFIKVNDFNDLPSDFTSIHSVKSKGISTQTSGTESFMWPNTPEGQQHLKEQEVIKTKRQEDINKKHKDQLEEKQKEVREELKNKQKEIATKKESSIYTVHSFIHLAAVSAIKNGFEQLEKEAKAETFKIYEVPTGSGNLPVRVKLKYLFTLKSKDPKISLKGDNRIKLEDIEVVVMKSRDATKLEGKDTIMHLAAPKDSSLKEYKVFSINDLTLQDEAEKLFINATPEDGAEPTDYTNFTEDKVTDKPLEGIENKPVVVPAGVTPEQSSGRPEVPEHLKHLFKK